MKLFSQYTYASGFYISHNYVMKIIHFFNKNMFFADDVKEQDGISSGVCRRILIASRPMNYLSLVSIWADDTRQSRQGSTQEERKKHLNWWIHLGRQREAKCHSFPWEKSGAGGWLIATEERERDEQGTLAVFPGGGNAWATRTGAGARRPAREGWCSRGCARVRGRQGGCSVCVLPPITVHEAAAGAAVMGALLLGLLLALAAPRLAVPPPAVLLLAGPDCVPPPAASALLARLNASDRFRIHPLGKHLKICQIFWSVEKLIILVSHVHETNDYKACM